MMNVWREIMVAPKYNRTDFEEENEKLQKQSPSKEKKVSSEKSHLKSQKYGQIRPRRFE